jgi:hypothetical protein
MYPITRAAPIPLVALTKFPKELLTNLRKGTLSEVGEGWFTEKHRAAGVLDPSAGREAPDVDSFPGVRL